MRGTEMAAYFRTFVTSQTKALMADLLETSREFGNETTSRQ